VGPSKEGEEVGGKGEREGMRKEEGKEEEGRKGGKGTLLRLRLSFGYARVSDLSNSSSRYSYL